MASQRPILIAGAGPVGVIAALALARQGFEVQVFEAEQRVNDNPRAATTHAATLEILEDLRLVDDVTQRGLIEPKFRIWDRASRELIVEFDFGALKTDTRYPFVVQCEQHKLANMTIERLGQVGHASVHVLFARGEFPAIRRSGRSRDRNRLGTRRIVGSYLIGCDGGRSTARKTLDIAFEGYTHPERFLVLTTPFSFDTVYAQCSRNYFSDADEWCALFKVSGDDGKGLWRVLFPTRSGETDAQALDEASGAAAAAEFLSQGRRLPGGPPQHLQRAPAGRGSVPQGPRFPRRRSAHVNNPLGGLGLNFGIHDAVELAGLLGLVMHGAAPAELLDGYDQRRRPLNVEYVQQQTIANKKRLEEKDPAARARNNAALRATAADPAAHRAYLLRASLIAAVRKAGQA